MKIQALSIERFGVWQDLSLSLPEAGMTAFYGPNEAGKSTLMRFIRGILYGFQPSDERSAGPEESYRRCAGSLSVTDHHNTRYELRRVSQSETRGRLIVNGRKSGRVAEDQLRRLLNGTSESLYESVFAIGLEELQQLSTLSGEDVARQIYGLSLGPEGKRLLSAQKTSRRVVTGLLDLASRKGTIVELAEELDKVDRDLDMIHDTQNRIAELGTERLRLFDQIDQRKQRQHVLQKNLRGYQFLGQVYNPWKRQNELRRELESLPPRREIGEDALDRFDEIENELEGLIGRRNRLLSEAKELETRAERSDYDPALEEHFCTIRTLLNQQDEIREKERLIAEHKERRRRELEEFERRLDELGVNATPDQLEQFDTSSAALSRLLQSGDQYRRAVRSRTRHVKRYKQLQSAAQTDLNSIKEQLRSLPEKSLLQAKKILQQRLNDLEEIQRLQTEAELLSQSKQALQEHIDLLPSQTDLPPYYYASLWIFGIGGLLLFVFGLLSLANQTVAGGNTAWIVGLIYLLLGLCCGGTTWTMKEHFSQFLGWDGERLPRRLQSVQREHEEIVRQIEAMQEFESPALMLLEMEHLQGRFLEQRSAILERLAQLDQLEQQQQAAADRRRQLSLLREQLQKCQKEVAASRARWMEVLRDIRLPEMLKVSKSLAIWQSLAQLQRDWSLWQWSDQQNQQDKQAVRSFREQISALSRVIPKSVQMPDDPYAVLAHWERRIHQIDASRREQKQLLQDARKHRRDAEELDQAIELLRGRRLSLLMSAGASDRDELANRIKEMFRRSELEKLIETAQKDLDAIARSEPELAIVEDDLLGFDENVNRQAIQNHRAELAQLNEELQSLHERMGVIKRELQQIEEDASLETLSRKRKRIALELREATQQWVAARVAEKGIERVRHRVERHGQPRTLKLASEYLERLTLGRYTNVWAPLGEKHLVIDDSSEESFQVQHLSSGTREQLFLATRMAIIREFAEQGIELPMVLDDVLVNFDQERTEAAVDALLEFADDGQQILFFTCHQHLADLFDHRGCQAIWLPDHRTIVQERVG